MESMKQRMLGGKLYKANNPEISVESLSEAVISSGSLII